MNKIQHSKDSPIKLTVVIIGRNEEQFIGKAIESVLKVESRIDGLEVIFVDSASTDRSVEIAMQYPIRIVQLRKEWPLCVAAGRYTGYRHSRGEYVFFQDGDSEAEADWLVKALTFMDAHPEYGGVAGVLDEVYLDSRGTPCGGDPNVFRQDLNQPVCDIKHLGGIALYRRRAMEIAGPVNPHLPTAEDHELCMRLRNSDFKLARIDGLMAVKFTENRKSIREVLRRTRTKMYDCGTVIRYAGLYGGAIQFSLESLSYVLSFSATVAFFIVAAPIAAFYGKLWAVLILAGLIGFSLVIKKGGLHGAALSIAVRSAITYRTIVSFLRTRTKRVEDYPSDVIVIR